MFDAALTRRKSGTAGMVKPGNRKKTRRGIMNR